MKVVFLLISFAVTITSARFLPFPHMRFHPRQLTSKYGPKTNNFRVKSIPDITHAIPRNWAGTIPIPETKDNRLFFWLFEAETPRPSTDLIIWLNGGPGCSSSAGQLTENGPVHLRLSGRSPKKNPFSWTKLAGVLYVDQPVGAGFSNGSSAARNLDEVTKHFYDWLRAFYTEFPALKSYNGYLGGESYAGTYIPYFAKKIVDNKARLPLKLKAMVIGAPTYGNYATMTDVSISKFMKARNSLLKIPADILAVFQNATNNCGFSSVIGKLGYPSRDKVTIPGNPENGNFKRDAFRRQTPQDCDALESPTTSTQVEKSISGGCFGSCATWTMATNYLMNKGFFIYNIERPLSDLLKSQANVAAYRNRGDVKKALHTPNKVFEACNTTIKNTLFPQHNQPPAYSILPSLVASGVKLHIYSGTNDMVINHIGTELVLQNMTWNGKQGLSLRPNKKFMINGKQVGEWGSDRSVSYHRIHKAGHFLPMDQPEATLVLLRDFVLREARSY